MRALNIPLAVFLLAAILSTASLTAMARQWKATPTTLAQDYVQIVDSRSQREIVLILWLSPQIVDDSPANAAAKEVLSSYVVVGIIHADISTLGRFAFRTPENVALRTAGGAERKPLDQSEVAPAAAGIVTVMQNVFSQALGPMGEGTRWVTFDAARISSCEEGVFWIDYDGEQYDYRTPIPGCP